MLAPALPTCIALSLSLSAAPAPPARAAASDGRRAPGAAEAQGAAEREALRALAAVAASEPGILEVQDAAARAAEESVAEAPGFPRRARIAALLPRVTAEYRRDERSYRVVGLEGTGEVDYQRRAPGVAFSIAATWELGELVAARGEIAAASAEGERARRRGEAVKRATALFYDRRRAQLALLLEPPEGALARAQAELEIDRLGAELDALTAGLLSGRRR